MYWLYVYAFIHLCVCVKYDNNMCVLYFVQSADIHGGTWDDFKCEQMD